jgi:hypothetical protein
VVIQKGLLMSTATITAYWWKAVQEDPNGLTQEGMLSRLAAKAVATFCSLYTEEDVLTVLGKFGVTKYAKTTR